MTDTSNSSASMPTTPMGSPRTRVIDALMALLAERPIERIGLADIAAKANVSLADMRGEFSSVMGILAAQVKETDRKVLAGGDADTEESLRDRLFDVLMRRLETLQPHRAAIRSLLGSSARNPGFAVAMNALGVKSQRWMMTAAGIEVRGAKGIARAQGLNLLYARVMCTFVNDDDPGLARTMAALDRELSRAARWSGFLDDLFCIPDMLCSGRRWRARRRPAREDDVVAV
jgi:AcrR family transcriptional regulator